MCKPEIRTCVIENRLPAHNAPFVLNESQRALLAQTTAAHTKRCTVRLQIVNPAIRWQTRSMYTSRINVHDFSKDVYFAMRFRYDSTVMEGVAREWNRVNAEGWRGSMSLCAVKRISMSATRMTISSESASSNSAGSTLTSSSPSVAASARLLAVVAVVDGVA